MVSVGWALEERSWARNLERLRVAAIGIALLLLPDWFGWEAPLWARSILAVAAVASLALLPTRPLLRPATG